MSIAAIIAYEEVMGSRCKQIKHRTNRQVPIQTNQIKNRESADKAAISAALNILFRN